MDSIFTSCRRLLEMAQVLHRQGYELLRIRPGMSPSGCHWRCEFLPSEMTVQGYRQKDNPIHVELAQYSSGDEKNYFGWTDAVSDSPEELAAKFVERFNDLARASKGKDPVYASWYSRMLEDTVPDGIIYSYADYPIPEDYLPVQNKPGVKIPLPPLPSFIRPPQDGGIPVGISIPKDQPRDFNAGRGIVPLERAGYFKALPRLSQATVDQLLNVLRQQHLQIEQIPSEYLNGPAFGPKITKGLTRLSLHLALSRKASWNGLVVGFPGTKKELTTGFVGTPYLRRILHPMLELFRRLRSTGGREIRCLYILGERFPDVILRKFRLLDQVIPHVIVLTCDMHKASKAMPPPVPESKNEAWVQAVLSKEMEKPHGLKVPYHGAQARLGYLGIELPTGEGTRNPERLDILAYDKKDHSLVAVEIKGPDANRIELENLFLQGLEHRNWLEDNKMGVKLIFDGIRGRRINTRKRVRLLLLFFEDRVPSLFQDLKDEAMRKDRHLSIDFGRLVFRGTDGLEVVPFRDFPSLR